MSELLDRLRRSRAREGSLPIAELLARVFAVPLGLWHAHGALRGCEQVGRWPRTRGEVHLEGAQIRLGDEFSADGRFAPVTLISAGAPLEIGSRVFINFGNTLRAAAPLRLGSRIDIGPHGSIDASDAPIEIGDDVWLGARVHVRSGARIGAGSVVAAGSVVEGAFPAGALIGGRPAHVLRFTGGRGKSLSDASRPVPPAPRSGAHEQSPAAALHTQAPLPAGADRWHARAAAPGADARVLGAPFVGLHGCASIGARFSLRSAPALSHLVVAPGARLRIGDDVVIGDGAAISVRSGLEIGDRVRFGQGVMLLDFAFHAIGAEGRLPPPKPISIGADAQLGDRVIVLGGVSIGAGARVCDDAVVTHDVPAGASVAGAPARETGGR